MKKSEAAALKPEDIRSIGWLYGEKGTIQLTPVFQNQSNPHIVRVSQNFFEGIKDDPEAMKKAAIEAIQGESVPLSTLRCPCCGAPSKGRQWWNRDTGYGICNDPKCWELNEISDVALLEKSMGFGVRGYHWDVTP